MSTIYEIQKLPESPDERPFIIAQNSKERGRCHSEKFFCLWSTERFYRRSGFGIFFRNAVCSLRSGWWWPLAGI